MNDGNRAELVELGLSPTEAQVYVALVQSASLSASALATATGLSRTSVYQILCALTDRGLVESGAGYGSKFAAVAPERALRALIAYEEEALTRRKEIAEQLSQRLAALAEPVEAAPEELIQIIRSPRAVADRFARLQLEAERQVDGFIKAPMLTAPPGNPAQEKARKRGVRYRALYEKAVLEEPGIKPYLKTWIDSGEEARVFDGELPHKLIIFDQKIVLVPLIVPGTQTRTILIRHPQLAQSLSLLFEFLWAQATPLVVGQEEKTDPTVSTRPVKKAKPGRQPVTTEPERIGPVHDGANRHA